MTWSNPALNASPTEHGLLPKLSGNVADVLRGDGTWGSVAAAAAANGDIDLANYISETATPSANLAGVRQAIIDTNQGTKGLSTPIGRFPMDYGLLMPPHPLRWYGKAKALSVFKYPQSTSATPAVSYDNSSAGHIQVGTKWYDNTSNGLNQNQSWDLSGLGFEGGDWNGTTTFGFYFPPWVTLGRTALQMNATDVAVYLFQGTGVQYEINGLAGDSVFTNFTVANCSGTGLIPGSDSRYINTLTYQNGNWGINPSDHRNLQMMGVKTYGNGQVDHTCGGMRIIGNMDAINNVYAQDNAAEGFRLDGGELVVAGQIICDRNCTNGTSHAGLVVNNINDCLVDGYASTDSQRTGDQTYAVQVTGTNSNSVINVVQHQSGTGGVPTGIVQPTPTAGVKVYYAGVLQ